MPRNPRPSNRARSEAEALQQVEDVPADLDPAELVYDSDDGSPRQSVDPDSEMATGQDWAVADSARPDFEDETDDGLSAVEEEVRHAAEDLPSENSWDDRVRRVAHMLWLDEGSPDDRADDHWRIASEMVARQEHAERSALPPYGDDDEAPVEEAAMLENLGEAPGLDDQAKDGDPPP